jgi:large subunit ribosomal protein L6
MSRVGNKPIPLPKGVKVSVGDELQVEGPKGKLSVPIPPGIKIKQENGILQLARESDEQAALHGLTRALAANAINGVATGFTKRLEIVGIGYRANVKGHIATFTLGYSHPIEVLLPDGVTMTVDKAFSVGGHPTLPILLTSYDKQLLGQVAANIRALRKPDPYKNKGIRYAGEVLRKKVGKTGATSAKA